MRARFRTHRRKPRPAAAPQDPPARLRDYAGWTLFLLLVAFFLGWYVWQHQPRNWPRPVAAHSTRLIRGTCAVDRRTGLVWGRVVRLGTPRGMMDRYVVQTLGRRRQFTNVALTEVRLVPCEHVTGPDRPDAWKPAPGADPS